MDAEARFRALFADAYPALHRYLRHRGVAPSDADDVVAATFEVAWRRRGELPEDTIPWLYGVARNVQRNAARGARRRGHLQLVVPAIPTAQLREPPDPTASEIVRALRALGDDDRELLILVAWDDLTPLQAAQVLEISPTAARSRLFRARQRLADALAAQRGAAGGQISADGEDRSPLTEVHDG